MNLITKKFLFNKSEISEFAKSFSSILSKGMIVFLIGDLGAGKTFFVQEVCDFLNENQDEIQKITSPTFVFYHIYQFPKINIWHYDLYRFENEISENDLINIDFFDAKEDGCVLIEWADKLDQKMREIDENSIVLKINFPKDPRKQEELREYEIQFNSSNEKLKNFFIDIKH